MHFLLLIFLLLPQNRVLAEIVLIYFLINDIALFQKFYEGISTDSNPIFQTWKFNEITQKLVEDKSFIIPSNPTEAQLQQIVNEAKKSLKSIERYIEVQKE